MFCPFCGKINSEEGNLFCGSCGGRFPSIDTQPSNSNQNATNNVSFQEFMAFRTGANKTESGISESLDFSQSLEAVKQVKAQERKFGFKKKKTRVEEKVQVKIGILHYANGTLKQKRGSSLPLEVAKDISSPALQTLAIKKHLAFNSQLPQDSNYKLLYPDYQPVDHIPGTKDKFTLQRYKECLGKPYQRLTLYLCYIQDFELFIKKSNGSSDESSDREHSTNSLDKTLDSSNEVLFHPKWSQSTEQTTVTSQMEGSGALSNVTAVKDVQSSYSNYCNIVAISDDDSEFDNDDIQMGLLNSVYQASGSSVKEQGNSTDLNSVGTVEQDIDDRTRQFLSDLQNEGTIDEIVIEAQKEGSKLDKSLGGGGKTGLPQFMVDYSKDKKDLHVKACQILANAQEQEVSTIQDYLLGHFPQVFGWDSKEETWLKGHYMTIATSNILTKINEKEDTKHHIKSTSDILRGLQIAQDDDFQVIRARRKHIWVDSLRAFQKPSFAFHKPIHVHFIAEEAVDAGGPRREFLRLLMKEIADKSGILEGSAGYKTMTSNPLLVARKTYYHAGKMVSASLRQGGPGLCCLSPNVYNYMCTSSQVCTATIEDIADHSTKSNIEMILNAEKDVFPTVCSNLSNFLIECCLSKLSWSFEEKESLVQLLCTYIVLHKNKVGLDQFMEGLREGGLLEPIQSSPIAMKELFVNCSNGIMMKDFRSLLTYNFSEEGSNAREDEEQAVLLWHEYLDELDSPSGNDMPTLEDLLIFITGADRVPPCGFESDIKICFYPTGKDFKKICRLPHASTCSLSLYLPLGVGSYGDFEFLLNRSLREYGGFGNV